MNWLKWYQKSILQGFGTDNVQLIEDCDLRRTKTDDCDLRRILGFQGFGISEFLAFQDCVPGCSKSRVNEELTPKWTWRFR